MGSKEAKMFHIQAQMKQAELYAQYWIASATTGATCSRKLFHGINGPEFTDVEKKAEALETALRHISRHCDLSNKMLELMNQD